MKHFYDAGQAYRAELSRTRTFAAQTLVPAYRVGQPLRQSQRSWPEGAQFTHSRGGHELTLFRAEINLTVVDDVSRGAAEFALVVEHPLIVLAYRFGDSIKWNDVPYCWHLQPADSRQVPALVSQAQTRALIWVTLVSTQDGIIRAQRGLTLSPQFTRAVNDAIRTQAKTSFDPRDYTAAISRAYVGFSSTESRLSIAVSRTMGNE
jgi:hypothetical protein